MAPDNKNSYVLVTSTAPNHTQAFRHERTYISNLAHPRGAAAPPDPLPYSGKLPPRSPCWQGLRLLDPPRKSRLNTGPRPATSKCSRWDPGPPGPARPQKRTNKPGQTAFRYPVLHYLGHLHRLSGGANSATSRI